MGTLVFKRFFEVRIVHEYFFIQPDGISIFDLDPKDWKDMIANKVIRNRYNILNDLTIEPTAECRKNMSDFYIRFGPKPTGFVLGIEVMDNALTTRIPKEMPLSLQFVVNVKNPAFGFYSNDFLGDGFYYFSNRTSQLDRLRNAPILSNTIADFTKNKAYKMGDLAIKSGSLQRARKNTKSGNVGDWMPLSKQSEKLSYVNAQDICRFKQRNIRFQTSEPIKKISAKLFADGIKTPLKVITGTFGEGNDTVTLDFSEDDNRHKISDGFYLLTVSYNDKPEESEMICFNDKLSALRPYAVIDITTDAVDSFKILNSGKLVRDADGKQPVFDLLFKSRATYWRYRSNSREKLKKPEGYNFLTENDRDLVTVDPRMLSAEASSFQRISSGVATSVFLPSPDVGSIQPGNDIFYSDVFVQKV